VDGSQGRIALHRSRGSSGSNDQKADHADDTQDEHDVEQARKASFFFHDDPRNVLIIALRRFLSWSAVARREQFDAVNSNDAPATKKSRTFDKLRGALYWQYLVKHE
jgi:hypothetical protein